MSRLARFLTVVTLALAAVLSATSAFAAEPAPPPAGHAAVAQDHSGGDATTQGQGSTIDVVPPLLWSVAGVGIGAVVLAVLYLLKRRLGGFPANPDWVAPITIMESKTFPKEGDFGDAPAAAHGAHH